MASDKVYRNLCKAFHLLYMMPLTSVSYVLLSLQIITLLKLRQVSHMGKNTEEFVVYDTGISKGHW